MDTASLARTLFHDQEKPKLTAATKSFRAKALCIKQTKNSKNNQDPNRTPNCIEEQNLHPFARTGKNQRFPNQHSHPKSRNLHRRFKKPNLQI
ncbi:hypothetical protein LR48_Vigan09g120900 [Vigna angularis]|uniref:Uncharacterized protein n=1 Tax=Phaseolus angularis TaxID=3914 RepID=A0A0L9VBW3_PHAAN|nr:hypothetical protein LR48_Vigan09g120900 [Vigna angularis]